MRQRQQQQQATYPNLGTRRGITTMGTSSYTRSLLWFILLCTLLILMGTGTNLMLSLTNGDYSATAAGGGGGGRGRGIKGGGKGGGGSFVDIRSDLSKRNPLNIWESILKAGSSGGGAKHRVAVEVGVHTPDACIRAAVLGYTAHCFEPSPKSYKRLEDGVTAPELSSEVKARLVPHRAAASDVAGVMIPFHSTGGTGDHVGEFDMWRMERRRKTAVEGNETDVDRRKRGEIVEVPTVRLDDFVTNDLQMRTSSGKAAIHLLKVDTQGYEPSIFAGISDTLTKKMVTYIIFEFWPRGMDLMAGSEGTCQAGAGVLRRLADAGYTLYALGVESHPKAPLRGGANLRREGSTRPMGGVNTMVVAEEYCRWFFDLEDRYPSSAGEEEYRFGYWSDFLAVAPGAKVPPEVFQ